MAVNHQRYFSLFLVFFSCFSCSSYAYQFVVGGRDGWVVNPSENYNHWSGRMRFQVNDSLLFRYKNGSDSVLVVNKDDYDKCNTGNPILKLDDGNSIFKFDRSGPFYFISGEKGNCDQGQKLIVVVLAVRNRLPPPSNSPSPAAAPPKGSSPSGSPTGGAPSPASSPLSPSPSGGAPSPAAFSPSSPSPAGDEAPSPAAFSPSSPSPAGGAYAPETSSSTTPGSPNSSATGSGTPADDNTTSGGSPPRSLATASCRPSIVFVATVAVVVLSVGFGGFIVSP